MLPGKWASGPARSKRIGFVTQERPYAQTLTRLREAGLRPTRQRLALGRLLFDGGDRHVTAEALHDEAQKAGVSVSLATVYNTLHQFTGAGLLREVVVDSSRTYFDTNNHYINNSNNSSNIDATYNPYHDAYLITNNCANDTANSSAIYCPYHNTYHITNKSSNASAIYYHY